MDRKQELIAIIKKAELPKNLESLFFDEVGKQMEISDEFIAEMADLLDRIGGYMQASGQIEDAYIDGVVEEARTIENSFEMMKFIEEELSKSAASPRESLQMFTGSGKAAA